MAVPPGSVKYFFGRITREEAEQFLNDSGLEDGLFLLRESMKRMGDYVLSLCFERSVHHYSMEQQDDGQLRIDNGRKFPGPIELVNYHQRHRDGLLTFPTVACNRPQGKSYVVFRGLSSHELDKLLLEKAREMNIKDTKLEEVLATHRTSLIDKVKGDLHKAQPWYHDVISREDAETVMTSSVLEDGKYLLRAQPDHKEYRLSLCCRRQIKHYIVSFKNKKYFIETGPQFDSLIELVDHYHNKADGLLCTLKVPCSCQHSASASASSDKQGTLITQTDNVAYEAGPPAATGSSTKGLVSPGGKGWAAPPVPATPRPVGTNSKPSFEFGINGSPTSPPHPTKAKQEGQVSVLGRPLPPKPTLSQGLKDGDDDSVSASSCGSPRVSIDLHEDAEANQKIYDSLPTSEVSMNLPKENIVLLGDLGSGCFGTVKKGLYKKGNVQVPVAIKSLKGEELVNGKEEIMKEARFMAELQHKHIVRIIGVCQDDSIMLVLELAELGPLHKYLKSHLELPMTKVALLMYQVALGMEFLESRNYVHRDLAARNVLLASDSFAKISDFGMSKAIGVGNEYYKAAKPGKWPLKWYAPECMYYYKFTPKSDVWSYGVTMWEATSYGKKPYARLKPQEIVSNIEEGIRMEKPSTCPKELYEIMLKCWSFDASDRPSFAEMVKLMKPLSMMKRF